MGEWQIHCTGKTSIRVLILELRRDQWLSHCRGDDEHR